jgi:hypothetical protein
MVGIYLNYARPPLNNTRIRQALNYAIDRDALNQAIALGLDVPTSAILPKEHWACDPASAQYYRHDPAMARKLLAEAGFPEGIDIPMLGWSDQISMQRQEVIVKSASGLAYAAQPVSASAKQPCSSAPPSRASAAWRRTAARPTRFRAENRSASDAYFNAVLELPGYRESRRPPWRTTDRAGRSGRQFPEVLWSRTRRPIVQHRYHSAIILGSNFVLG